MTDEKVFAMRSWLTRQGGFSHYAYAIYATSVGEAITEDITTATDTDIQISLGFVDNFPDVKHVLTDVGKLIPSLRVLLPHWDELTELYRLSISERKGLVGGYRSALRRRVQAIRRAHDVAKRSI